MTTERFHLGAVLSMTTGKLLCPIDDLYRIAQHLAGEPVWTHQLPRVMRESQPHLLAQLPNLSAVTGDGVTRENWKEWLAEQVAILGESADQHESIDPMSELVEKVHPDRIITVKVA